jgi:hypothetical protein
MSKIVINMVSESATNPYLAADGLVNPVAFSRLATKINRANASILSDAEAQGQKRGPKVLFPIVYSRKDIAKYLASLDKKGDHKYLTLRGQQLKTRTKMPPAGSSLKFKMLLPAAYEGIDKALAAEVKKAMSAVTMHNKKALRVTEKVKTEKGKIRDAANAEFDDNVQALTDELLNAGFKETDLVVSQGMMGKTVLLKLPNGGVVSIGKSDMSRFRAAKKLASTNSNGTTSGKR